MDNQTRLSGKSWLIVGACVLAPLAALLAVLAFKVPVGTVFYFALIALCPLMHVLMMRGHGHGSPGSGSANEHCAHETQGQSSSVPAGRNADRSPGPHQSCETSEAESNTGRA